MFDVPEDVAKELVTKQGNPGDVFELVQKVRVHCTLPMFCT